MGQLCIDPEYYNQHVGNTVTHTCSEGTPHGGIVVLQGNAGKIEKSSKYSCNQLQTQPGKKHVFRFITM
jgi:hypothetical protein